MKRLLYCVVACGLWACDSSSGSDDFEAQLARDDCDRECTNLNVGSDGCVPAATLTACKEQCLTVSPTQARGFADCMDAAFGFECAPKQDCVQNFGVGDSSTTNNATNGATNNVTVDPVANCKSYCDHIATECPEDADPLLTADCKAACDASIPDAVESFNACVDANFYSCTSGDLQACYGHLGVVP